MAVWPLYRMEKYKEISEEMETEDEIRQRETTLAMDGGKRKNLPSNEDSKSCSRGQETSGTKFKISIQLEEIQNPK